MALEKVRELWLSIKETLRSGKCWICQKEGIVGLMSHLKREHRVGQFDLEGAAKWHPYVQVPLVNA